MGMLLSSDQPRIVSDGQGQQVHIRQLAVSRQLPGIHPRIVQQAHVIGDEAMMYGASQINSDFPFSL